MPTEQANDLRALLKENVYNLTVCGGAGKIVNLPEYEIHPRDFLQFAEEEIDDLKSTKSIINCVSNLKRAIDCQIDVFLFSLNLQKHYKDKRLGIDRKLGFIEKCGLFSKTSLSTINAIRNKLEHHYQLPKIDHIHVYFDLVTAFIAVLENAISIAGNNCEVEFEIGEWQGDNDEPTKVGSLTSTYIEEKPQVRISYSKSGVGKEFIASVDNLEELAFFVKVHSLLLNVSKTYHGQYANNEIEKL